MCCYVSMSCQHRLEFHSRSSLIMMSIERLRLSIVVSEQIKINLIHIHIDYTDYTTLSVVSSVVMSSLSFLPRHFFLFSLFNVFLLRNILSRPQHLVREFATTCYRAIVELLPNYCRTSLPKMLTETIAQPAYSVREWFFGVVSLHRCCPQSSQHGHNTQI